ncbi:MAG: hypothetical protein IID61_06675, partial [SAR324 cluster bacterium]|nr:hypothetical protein [SAR324 cluster bacterium]
MDRIAASKGAYRFPRRWNNISSSPLLLAIALSGALALAGCDQITGDDKSNNKDDATLEPEPVSLCEGKDQSLASDFRIINNTGVTLYLFEASAADENLIACLGDGELDFGIEFLERNSALRLLVAVEESEYLDGEATELDSVEVFADRPGSWAPDSATASLEKGKLLIVNLQDLILQIHRDSATTGPIVGYCDRGQTDCLIYLPVGLAHLFVKAVDLDFLLCTEDIFDIVADQDRSWLDPAEDPPCGVIVDEQIFEVRNSTPDVYLILEGNTEVGSIGAQSTTENINLNFSVSSTDAESTPVVTTSALPGSATFTPSAGGGTFDWTPGFLESGTYSVTFYATDDSAAVDSEVVTITVNEAGNQQPVLV